MTTIKQGGYRETTKEEDFNKETMIGLAKGHGKPKRVAVKTGHRFRKLSKAANKKIAGRKTARK